MTLRQAASPQPPKPARARSKRTIQGIHSRLGQITDHGACKLMHEQEGKSLLRRGTKHDINLPRDVRFVGDTLRVNIADASLGRSAEVTFVEVPASPRGLHVNCNCCPTRSSHIAAALNLVLDKQLALGLSAPPDPNDPLAKLTEEELVRRALADRE